MFRLGEIGMSGTLAEAECDNKLDDAAALLEEAEDEDDEDTDADADDAAADDEADDCSADGAALLEKPQVPTLNLNSQTSR